MLDSEDIFKIQKEGNNYSVLVRGHLLRTPGGSVIRLPKRALFQRIIADFDGEAPITENNGIIESPRVHSAYLLASTQIDFVDKGVHPYRSTAKFLSEDPIFNTSADPNIYIYQLGSFQNAMEFFSQKKLKYKTIQEMNNSDISAVAGVFDKLAADLSNPEISVLINLYTIHHGHFVYPMLLMKSLCSPMEYAKAIFAGSPDVVRIIGQKPLGAFMSIPAEEDDTENKNEIKKMIRSYKDDAEIAVKYIRAIQ